MQVALLILHLLVCLGLISVVLVQSGKGGGLAGGAFGGSAQTVFGGRGATDFITRATMVLGGLFFLTSLVLALMSSGMGGTRAKSLIQEEARKAAATAPVPSTGGATPAPATPAPAGTPTPAPAGGNK
jgi:preprotein translocase subunit SecG